MIIITVLILLLLFIFVYHIIRIHMLGSSAPHPKAELVDESNLIYIMDSNGKVGTNGFTFEQANDMRLQPNQYFAYKTASTNEKTKGEIMYRPYSLNFYSFRYEASGKTIKNVFKLGSLTDKSTHNDYQLDITASEMLSHMDKIIPKLSSKTPCNFKIIFAPQYLYVNMLIQSKHIEYCNLKLFDLELYLQQVIFSYLQTKSTHLVKESDSNKNNVNDINFCYAARESTKAENAEMYVDTTFTKEQFFEISNELITLLVEKIEGIIANNNIIPSFVKECFEYDANNIYNDRILSDFNLRFSGRFKEYRNCADKAVDAIKGIHTDDNEESADNSIVEDEQTAYSLLINDYDKVLRIIYTICDTPDTIAKISVRPEIDMKTSTNIIKAANKSFERYAISEIQNNKINIITELINRIDNDVNKAFVQYVQIHGRLQYRISQSISEVLTNILNEWFKRIMSDMNKYYDIVYDEVKKKAQLYNAFTTYYTDKDEDYVKRKILKQMTNTETNKLVTHDLSRNQVSAIVTSFKK